jgi:hypothetical protein
MQVVGQYTFFTAIAAQFIFLSGMNNDATMLS